MKTEELRRLVTVLGIFLGICIAFTVVSLFSSSPAERVGTLRSLGTVPIHELMLLGMGVAIGVLACVASKRIEIPFIIFPVVFILLLDVDHLPSMLSIAQPIRPAHSILLALAVVACLVLIRQPLEVELLFTSAFLGHLGIDTDVFPLFSPVSFEDYSLASYRVEIIVASLLVGVAAGFYSRRRWKFRQSAPDET